MTNTSEPAAASEFPAEGRLLGIDFGTKRVGIAICNSDRTIASPVEIYQRRNDRLDGDYFRELAAGYRIAGFVVGLPMHVNGTEGVKAREARAYGDWLHQLTGLPVTYWDERYTSAVAEEYLLAAELTRKQRKARIDKLAAQILLQGYLEHQLRLRRDAEHAAMIEEDAETNESVDAPDD
ncbi:MAG: Holliday junction resolvase RuvX [Planctomycetaceae bacterium]|nr:Holliday junction resolvase RuvX [Planctomycetaceae bacterium]